MNKNRFIIFVLILLLIIVSSYIAYKEIEDYGKRQYSKGMQEGQLVLAADQLGRQQCVFFNGTQIKTIKIDDLCEG